MHPRFQAAFSQLAENLQSATAPVLADAHFPALLTADQVTTLKQATGWTKTRWLSPCCPRRLPAPALIFPILT